MKLAKRLDVFLTENNLVDSREKAKRLIMAGKVRVNGIVAKKASDKVVDSSEITLEDKQAFVGRGGFKIEKALNEFDISVTDLVLMDVGASTGGFTDCLLKRGAKKVYSIDVGYGQLDWRLRTDDRVEVMERTNARYLKPSDFDQLPCGAVMDVSFISIKKIIPALMNIIGKDGFIASLIKPQFEAGRGKVGKNGIITNPQTHIDVLKDMIAFADETQNLSIGGITFSPIKGAGGNVEFLMHFIIGEKKAKVTDWNEQINILVETAHKLKK